MMSNDAPRLDANGSSSQKAPLAEFRNGKIIFKQKPLSFEKLSETLKDIVDFRAFMEKRVEESAAPLSEIPDSFKPLIAKLCHESDKSLIVLTKQIRAQLLPSQDEDDDEAAFAKYSNMLPLRMVENSIHSILTRCNYGLEVPQLGGKLSAGLCIWRWEVKDEYWEWIPKSARDKAENRRVERIQTHAELQSKFQALSQDERDVLLATHKSSGKPSKDSKENATVPVSEDASPSKLEVSSAATIPEPVNNSGSALQGTGKSKPKQEKVLDPAKSVKEKEKADRLAAKAEKEKKEKEKEGKSRSLMANFFVKPKAPSSSGNKNISTSEPAGVSKDSKPSTLSDFQKKFKPFVVKKGTEVAPINWFVVNERRQSEVIDIDDDDTLSPMKVKKPIVTVSPQNLGSMSPIDHLRSLVCIMSPPLSKAPRQSLLPSDSKNAWKGKSVRALMVDLTEAEISGDDLIVRRVLDMFASRDILPVHVLIFHDDARPGYFGTWTRKSKSIGPRTPLVRDAVEFDYLYDSGEEWEEEAAGDADDLEGEDDDDGEIEDRDSDLDSWLVEDDEIEEETPTDILEFDSPLPDVSMPPPPKRKAVDAEKREIKRRKVIPLVPFIKGPHWEETIGDRIPDVFVPYQIRMLNDAPFALDPFTFVSQAKPVRRRKIHNPIASTSVDTLITPASCSSQTAAADLSASVPPMSLIKTATAPKTTFPDAHMGTLLEKIVSTQTSSLPVLVEAVYQELRLHKVKKNAIEVRIKEVGEKDARKIWVVKPGILELEQRSSLMH